MYPGNMDGLARELGRQFKDFVNLNLAETVEKGIASHIYWAVVVILTHELKRND
jgi:hypothetical protein